MPSFRNFHSPESFYKLGSKHPICILAIPWYSCTALRFRLFLISTATKVQSFASCTCKIEESLQLHVIFATSRDHAQNFMTDFASIPQRSNWSICNKRYRKNVCTVSISQNSPQEQDWRECYRNSLASHETGIVWTLRRTAFPQYHQSFLPAEETKANSLRI